MTATVLVAGGRKLHLEKYPHKGLIDWGPAFALVDAVADLYRRELIGGAKVVELGCGLGLPSLVCACLGASVVATDLPDLVVPVEFNAQASGWPQRVWKVVGGRTAGGLAVVSADPNHRGDLPRLACDALVEELKLTGDSLEYKLLQGAGPPTGVVTVRRFGGGELVARTLERPQLQGVPGTVRTEALDWDADGALQLAATLDGTADLVLCSDCVNEPLYGESWVQLADCLDVLCGPRTAALMSVQRRLEDGIDDFLGHLRDMNFLVENVSSKVIAGKEVRVLCARRRTPSERFAGLLDSRSLEALAAEERGKPAGKRPVNGKR